MTKKITFKRTTGRFLLVLCLAGSSLFNQSYAKITARGMGGGTDTIAPVIYINGKDTVYVEVFGTYIEDGAAAMDNRDGNVTNAIVLTGAVNTKSIGIYILTFTVKDVSGNTTSKNRVVIVGDSQKPIISNNDADANNNIKVQVVSMFIDRTKVTDNYDMPTLVVTPGSAGGVDPRFMGIYPITYNATDGSGNKADTKTYNYIVDDYIPPTINLNTADEISWIVNTPYTPVQPTVTDNYYNSSQISLTKTSNVNPNKLGLYYEEYTATDGSGNISIRRRYVRIVEAPAGIAIQDKNIPFYLYPNPSTGIVNILFNYTNTENTEIEIYNFTGKLVAESKGTNRINLGEEANGIYTLRIKTDTGMFTQKVSIQK